MEIAYIIPTLNEGDHLGRTLDSVIKQAGEKEIIVADGGSQDNTLKIARDYGCLTISTSPGRGTQMNRGAAAAIKDTLLFLHGDTILPNGASEEVSRILIHQKAMAGAFHLQFEPDSPSLRIFAAFSKINSPLFTYGDQGLFMRKSAFRSIGGFQEYPILEDVEIQHRIRSRGRFLKSRLPVVTSSRRFTKIGPIRQQLLNCLILAAYYGGESPCDLAKLYSHIR